MIQNQDCQVLLCIIRIRNSLDIREEGRRVILLFLEKTLSNFHARAYGLGVAIRTRYSNYSANKNFIDDDTRQPVDWLGLIFLPTLTLDSRSSTGNLKWEGEQFPTLSQLCSISFEHEARFYVECQAFYIFTLDFMNRVESKNSTEDVSSPCEVLVRPKSYKKPAKYDIQPLPQIDESNECSESNGERGKNVELASRTLMTAGYDVDHDRHGQPSAMAFSMPMAVSPSDGYFSFGFPIPPVPSSSPMLQMVQDLGNSPLFIPTTPSSNKSLDAICGTSEASKDKIASTVHDGSNLIHSTSEDPLIKKLDRILMTSRFPNLVYDTQSGRYIKKQKSEMDGSSRLSMDLQIENMDATADAVKGEEGNVVGRILRPEASVMRYTTSKGVTGVRPLRMKPQTQPSRLYRDFRDALGNGDDEIVAKGQMRTASEPERIGSPGSDHQMGRLRSDTEPIQRISRNPYANMSRTLDESPTSPRLVSRRKKVGPIYLPACNEDEETSPRRLFTPVNTRTPLPRLYTARSPPPTDRPYRHLSRRPTDDISHVDTPSTQNPSSDEGNPPPIVADIISFEPPPTPTESPAVDTSSFVPESETILSRTIPKGPIRVPSYILNLPQIFSSPSPIAVPPKLPSAAPAGPSIHPDPNISSPPISDQETAMADSTMYSIYTPDSSPHDSAMISSTLSRIPSIPSPPNTPKTALGRSDTINTASTATKTGTFTHSRHNTNSTMASSIDFDISSPISSLAPFPNPSLCPQSLPSLNPSPFPNTSPFRSSPPFHNPPPIPSPSPTANTNPLPGARLSNLSQESIALTEHLVREGIYGGVVYDIAAATPNHNTQAFASKPRHLLPKPTPSQLRRQKKRAAKQANASLRKREGEEKRSGKTLSKNLKARTRTAKLTVQSKRGTVSYSKIGIFFRGVGRGVHVRWQGVRRRLADVEFARILGARPEGKGVGVGVGDGYDFVCRGEGGMEDREGEDVRGGLFARGEGEGCAAVENQ